MGDSVKKLIKHLILLVLPVLFQLRSFHSFNRKYLYQSFQFLHSNFVYQKPVLKLIFQVAMYTAVLRIIVRF